LGAGLAAHGLLAIEGVDGAGMPTVGRYLSRSGTPNGDCGMVFERRWETS